MGRAPRLWLLLAALMAAPGVASGQGLVVRDGTLGSGALEVGPGVDPLGESATYLITPELGEQRGSNLFHSFSSFSVGRGETATFTGPDPIDGPQSVSNVISRVTGGDPSEIDGTLRSTIPGADVWLLNPSGVVFGEGAQLDVPGSFHVGTGDSVGFEGGLERFYADPARPSVLATARPEAFGFLGESEAAPISVTGARLAVDPGEHIELAGGDVTLTAATLDAPGGAVSIRGGRIVLQEGSKVLAETASESPAGTLTVEAGESVLVDDSLLSVNTSSPGDAGTIRVDSPEIILQNGLGLVDITKPPSDDANLPHEIEVGARAETTGGGRAGLIEIDAKSVEVLDGAGLSAQTVGANGAEASGGGGTVRVVGADLVRVAERGFVTVESWGSSGDAGTIEILDVGTLTVDGNWLTTITAGSLAPTSRFSPFEASRKQAPGKAGRIEITAKSVNLENGGLIQSSCFDCVGGGGQVHITAQDLTAEGLGTLSDSNLRTRRGIGSGVSTNTVGGEGNAGNVVIDLTGGLTLLRGAQIDASAFDGATGKGGSVSVHADEVIIQREQADRGTGIFAFSSGVLGSRGTGDAGDIAIEAHSLVLGSEGRLDANSAGVSGKAGSVKVRVGSLVISGGGLITAATVGVGSAGSGDAGAVDIEAGSLVISGGGLITAATAGSGDAGAVDIDAGSLLIAPGGVIGAEAAVGSSGKAGTVTIRTDSLHIGPHADVPRAPGNGAIPGASITASSFGPGKAGTVDVRATESIFLTYVGGPRFDLRLFLVRQALGAPALLSGIFSATVGSGGGGSVTLRAPDITVTDGAIVATSTVGGGAGGAIELFGDRIRVTNGALVDSTSVPNSLTGTPGGDAGSVTLRAEEWIHVIGSHPQFGDVSRVASASLGSGAAGSVTLAAPRILVDGGAVATTAVPDAGGSEGERGGEIYLDAEQLIVRGGGRVDASTFIAGPGGSIDVTASESIVVEGEGSGIASRTGGSGMGGDVGLQAPVITLSNGGEASARSEAGLGEVGEIFQGLVGEPPSVATGDAGSVTLVADKLKLFGGTIATSSEAADGGDIEIQASKLVHLDAGEITAAVNNGTGGNITIDPEVVILQNGSRIVADAGAGSGGNIRITADSYFAFPGSVVDASSDLGLDGVVEVSTPDVNLAGALTSLPSNYLDAASLMKEPCAARRSGERAGSFAVHGPDGIPPEPDGWLTGTVGLTGTPGPSFESTAVSGLARPGLVAATACR